jgi:hypothetical protein
MQHYTHDEIFQAGKQRGEQIAKYADLPAFTVGDASQDAAFEKFVEDCNEAEGHGRDFSPFEFTSHALNERPDSECAWECFERGIGCGIADVASQRIYG